jgi:hypothetical protein
LVLNGFGPVGSYYAGSQVGGVLGGIVAAAAVSLSLWAWERRAGRPGLLARLSLALVLIQVTLGLLTHSAFLYFAPKAAADIVEGLAFYGSCFTRWPLATIFGRELLELPRSFCSEPPVRRVFIRITVAWGTYFTLRGAVCLAILAGSTTETYLLVRALIDAPVVLPLVAGSVAYGVRRIRALDGDARPGGRRALEADPALGRS